MKKIIKFLAVVLLITSIFQMPVTVSAEANVVDSGSAGENITWNLYDDGLLEFTGSGEMYDYPEDPEWFPYVNQIERIEISDGITSIGVYAFYGHTSLTEIDIPNSVTKIDEGAFAYCESLTSVDIPDSVTEIGAYAFAYCSALASLDIPNSVTKIDEGTFEYCESLTSVDIPDSVTSIGPWAFACCSALASLDIPDSVTTIGEAAFYDCESFTLSNIPEGVEAVIAKGTDGDNITWVLNYDGSLVISGSGKMKDYFDDHVPPWSRYTVYADAITSVIINEGITYVGNFSFVRCKNLKSISIPDSVISIGAGVFSGCESLKAIKIPESVSEMDLGSTFMHCKSLISFEIPNCVTEIGAYAFAGCISLESMVIPATINTIQCGAFKNCTNLNEITFLGDAPSFTKVYLPDLDLPDPFIGVTANVYYPGDNATYTDEVKQNYGGNLTWIPYDSEPTPTPGTEAEVVRIKGTTRYQTSLEIADALKEALNVEQFDTVILANGRDFADALAGSYLAAVKDAPILMVDSKNNNMDEIITYLNSNMNKSGKIYILGGEAAVPTFADDALTANGYSFTRLKGSNRYGTNLAILTEAGVTDQPILVANAKNFADSLSASATGLPMLLVGSSLNDAQKAFLEAHRGNQIYVLGGEAAVSTTVETALRDYGDVERIKGASRYETTIEIAKKFFPDADTVVMAYAKNFPDGLCGGPLAYAMNAPLILTATGNNVAATYTTSKGIKSGAVLGGATLISDDAVKNALGKTPILK